MKIIITKIEITSFGCFKNKVMTPSEGINRIIAPNESGKSTTSAFIKFMFYGFGNSKKDIMDSDKKMYLPWDYPVASGALEILADGVPVRIERKYSPTQKELVSITDITTGRAIHTGLCPGEVFFGADLETAEKTFIFDQYCALTARDSELFDSIRSIIFHGDEGANSENAVKRLKEARKELKNSRGAGIIENLEKEFTKYKSAYDESMGKLAKLKEINEQIATLEKNVERNSQNEKKLLDEKENLEKYNALLKLKELNELEKEAVNAENAYRIAVSSLEGAGIPDTEMLESLINANTEKLSFTSIKDELKATLEKNKNELSSLEAKNVKSAETNEEIEETLSGFTGSIKKLYLFAGISGIVGVIAGAMSFADVGFALPVAGVLLALSAVLSFLGIKKTSEKSKYINGFGVKTEPELLALLNSRKETTELISEKKEEIKVNESRLKDVINHINSLDDELSKVLGCYFKDVSEDCAELIRKLRVIAEKVAEAKKTAISKREALLKTAELLDKKSLEEKSIGAKEPTRPAEEIEKQLRFVQSGIKLMEEKIITAEKEKAVIESSVAPPSVLFEKAEVTYKKLTSAKERLEAIDLALTLIEKASEEMKSTLAPKITAYASELFSIATDGKYKSLNVTTELSLTTDNGETVKSAEYLSAGARSTAYVCLRLALLKAVYGDVFPPIIFDDAFVRLDEKRLEQIKKAILSSPAKDTQIFVFSANENQSI